MKNKKLLLSVLSTAVVASMASSAFAAEAGIYIGGDVKHYYNISSFFEPTNSAKIVSEANSAKLKNVVFVDTTGKAATLDNILASGSAALTDDLEAVFGDSLHDAYVPVDKNGQEGTDPVVPEPSDSPSVDGLTQVVDGGKVTISGNAVNADSVEVTVFKASEKVATKSVDVADNKFSVDFADLVAGDYTYEVVASNADEDSEVKSGSFKVEAPAELKVDSVSAINLRTVVVNFNKAVDENTLSSTTVAVAGYTYDTNLDGAGDYSYGLSEDGKTLTITLVGVAQNAQLTVNINGVKTAAGEELKNFSQTVTALDTTTPNATTLKTTAPNTFTVSFTEPLKTAPTIKINDGAVSNVVSFVPGDDFVTVTAAALTAGDNKVTIEGGADYADLPVVKQDKSLKYEVANTAPVVSVKASTGNSVTLKFDRNVTGILNHTTEFSHTYPGLNKEYGDTDVTQISASEYRVDFANPLPPGTTKIYINYAAGTADTDKIKDGFGNVMAATALDVTTTADSVKPEVSTVALDSTTGKVVVTFSEKVETASAQARTNYILRNSLNQIVNVLSATQIADNKVELNVGTLKAGNYSLEVSNIKDVAVVPNTLDKVTKTFAVADTTAPALDTAINTTGTTVRVTFTKNMNSSDLVNKVYYLFDGKALPAGTTVAAAGSKAVDITFPVGTTLVGKNIVVNGEMRDSLGNKVGGFASNPVAIVASVASAITDANLDAVTFVSNNKFQFTVDQHLTAVDATKFKITTGALSNAAVAGDVTYVNNPDGTATVTVVTDTTGTGGINTSVASDLHDLAEINLASGALTNAYNVASTAITVDDADVTDGIKASLGSAVTGDLDADGQIDTVVVTMDEAVKADSVQTADFTVEGYVVKSVKSVNGATVTLSIQESGIADSAATPKVTLVGTVEDMNGNAGIGSTKEVTATDAVVPVIISAQYALDGITPKVTITFSEAVGDDSATPAALTNGDILFTDGGSGTATIAVGGVVHTVATDTVVITLTAAPTAGATVNAVATKVEDAAGNAAAATPVNVSGITTP